MAIKLFRPTTPSRRFITVEDFSALSKDGPLKKLVAPKKNTGARNNYGRITSRFKGGGHKRKYRLIDFKRDNVGVPGKVVAIEYDPNRSCRIALVSFADGQYRYILCPVGLQTGSDVVSSPVADIKPGNCLPIANIPVGVFLHNIELKPGCGGQIVRSAGASAQLVSKEGKYAQVKLPSGEVRKILLTCVASIGQVGNVEHENVCIGKAGRTRWLGKRPHNRGVSMNPVDHPHGGGEGKTSGGRHPVTPWGKPTRGYKTRKKKSRTNIMIVKGRK